MTAEEERQMAADKSLPLWRNWREASGHAVLMLGDPGDWQGPRAVPVVRLDCMSDGHGQRPAVVTGRVRFPWWPEERREHAAYCQMCARLAVFMGWFTPDFDGWQP